MESLQQDKLTFDEILSRLEAERKRDTVVTRTADYLEAASLLDETKDVLQEARTKLMQEEPRGLFLSFLKDTVEELKKAPRTHKYKYAKQLDEVALKGLGISIEDIGIRFAGSQSIKIVGEPFWLGVKKHLDETVFGDYFIETYSVPDDALLWNPEFPLRISACDASQHRFKLRVPLNKTWATPVVVNNAAGTIKEREGRDSTWRPIAIPKDSREYENWVIIGPEDFESMNEEDYEWATKSSMDVGQFFIEETFIFKHGGLTLRPDVHFRDGRIFPQDCHPFNCKIGNRHGQLTREAIYRMTSTVRSANELKIIYCGVAKQVQLKVYSTIINWYITKKMGKENWNPTGHILTDSEMIRNMLYSEDFSARAFEHIYVTCPILRRFETVANLNRRTRKQIQNDLDNLNSTYHNRYLTAREIVDEVLKVNVVMFFAGHSRTDELYIPRYEFSAPTNLNSDNIKDYMLRILSALRLASFDVDEDHLWGLEEPIRTLVPTPILVAHDLSKEIGEELASNFSQKATAEFIKRLKEKKTLL